jgi:hypothetical protein
MNILKLKHWQIFLIFVVILLVTSSIPLLVKSNGYEFASTVIGNILAFGYPFLLGYHFFKYLPSAGITVKEKNSFILFGLVGPLIGLLDIIFIPKKVEPFNIMIDIGFIIIAFYSLIRFIAFPAKILNSMELKREPTVWEYFADWFLILWWPLGIFWLQPRINKIFERETLRRGFNP